MHSAPPPLPVWIFPTALGVFVGVLWPLSVKYDAKNDDKDGVLAAVAKTKKAQPPRKPSEWKKRDVILDWLRKQGVKI